MKKALLVILAVASLLYLIPKAISLWQDNKERIAALEVSAATEKVRADMWQNRSENQRIVADRLAESNAALRARNRATIVRVDSFTVTAPDTCQPFIDSLGVVVTGLLQEADSVKAEADSLRSANTSLDSSVTSWKRVAADLEEAKDLAKEEAKISIWERLKPSIGPGVALILTPDGEIESGIGLTVNWSF